MGGIGSKLMLLIVKKKMSGWGQNKLGSLLADKEDIIDEWL